MCPFVNNDVLKTVHKQIPSAGPAIFFAAETAAQEIGEGQDAYSPPITGATQALKAIEGGVTAEEGPGQTADTTEGPSWPEPNGFFYQRNKRLIILYELAGKYAKAADARLANISRLFEALHDVSLVQNQQQKQALALHIADEYQQAAEDYFRAGLLGKVIETCVALKRFETQYHNELTAGHLTIVDGHELAIKFYDREIKRIMTEGSKTKASTEGRAADITMEKIHFITSKNLASTYPPSKAQDLEGECRFAANLYRMAAGQAGQEGRVHEQASLLEKAANAFLEATKLVYSTRLKKIIEYKDETVRIAFDGEAVSILLDMDNCYQEAINTYKELVALRLKPKEMARLDAKLIETLRARVFFLTQDSEIISDSLVNRVVAGIGGLEQYEDAARPFDYMAAAALLGNNQKNEMAIKYFSMATSQLKEGAALWTNYDTMDMKTKELGSAFEKQGRYDLALHVYKEMEGAFADFAFRDRFFVQKARCEAEISAQQGRLKEAANQYRSLINAVLKQGRITTDSLDTLLRRGVEICCAARQFKAALVLLTEAKGLHFKGADFDQFSKKEVLPFRHGYLNTAYAAKAAGDTESAIAAYELALPTFNCNDRDKYEPIIKDTHLNIAELYEGQNKYDEAASHVEEAARAETPWSLRDAAILFDRAVALYKKGGNLKKALFALIEKRNMIILSIIKTTLEDIDNGKLRLLAAICREITKDFKAMLNTIDDVSTVNALVDEITKGPKGKYNPDVASVLSDFSSEITLAGDERVAMIYLKNKDYENAALRFIFIYREMFDADLFETNPPAENLDNYITLSRAALLALLKEARDLETTDKLGSIRKYHFIESTCSDSKLWDKDPIERIATIAKMRGMALTLSFLNEVGAEKAGDMGRPDERRAMQNYLSELAKVQNLDMFKTGETIVEYLRQKPQFRGVSDAELMAMTKYYWKTWWDEHRGNDAMTIDRKTLVPHKFLIWLNRAVEEDGKIQTGLFELSGTIVSRFEEGKEEGLFGSMKDLLKYRANK